MDISFALNQVHCLDVFEALNKMPDECVQMVVTSPPYYRQRDYEMDGQIGNESTVEEYVDKLCDVFDAVKRVLKVDGVFFLNLGDTFANKEIMGVPWRVALMMQRRGWHLRTDIIWEKADPMPEPVKVKRPTRAHEYIFMFSKDDKYYYDWEAIGEDIENPGSPRRFSKPGNKDRHDQERIYDPSQYTKRNKRSVWNMPVGKSEVAEHYAPYPEELPKLAIKCASREGDIVLDPFMGSGTTGVVALRLRRQFLGFDLNPNYCRIANERIEAARHGMNLQQYRSGQKSLPGLPLVGE